MRGLHVIHADAASYHPETLVLLEEATDHLRRVAPSDLPSALRDLRAQAIFVGLGTIVDRSLLDLAPDLACVVTPTTSLNHLDLPQLAERGIHVLSLQGRLDLLHDITAVAEMTWALLLCTTRRLRTAAIGPDRDSWTRDGLLGIELRGRTLGVVGLGRIGSAVARIGVAFGMTVLYSDVVAKPEAVDIPAKRVSLPDLFAMSEAVTLHAPLSPDRTPLVTRSLLQRMRPGTTFVNTAQGELVDEQALAELVARGRIHAAVDVLAGDSRWTEAPRAHALLDLARQGDHLLVTPHIGGFSDRSVRLVRHRLVEEFIRWAKART